MCLVMIEPGGRALPPAPHRSSVWAVALVCADSGAGSGRLEDNWPNSALLSQEDPEPWDGRSASVQACKAAPGGVSQTSRETPSLGYILQS